MTTVGTPPSAERFYAHSRNERGVRQGLEEHLRAVSETAGAFGAAFGAAALARAAGLWHDIGKYDPAFQRYLLATEAGLQERGTGPSHKGAGAVHAVRMCEALAFPTAGHHGGLMDRADVMSHLQEWAGAAGTEDALARTPPRVLSPGYPMDLPGSLTSSLDIELFIRLLFSCLVDADYLDTERHFDAGRNQARVLSPSLPALWEPFVAHHARLPKGNGPVSEVRRQVYAACLDASSWPRGMFRLTVPTGGGKTLSSMGFALRHAMQHGMARVVMAVPFTTITEQTATVYRDAFGLEGAVLEHHSAVDASRLDDQTREGLWARLAAENWDAPVIVTTTVQLFESLFASGTSRCRKLHRLVNSVIILDEAQSLPTHLLEPILDVLQSLVDSYGSTVVLCTATQPALDDAPGFKGLRGVTEIVPDPARLFLSLQRVDYVLAIDDPWDWSRVAREMTAERQALAVCNTIADAQSLFAQLGGGAFHLSTRLCGAHRRRVLREIRDRLRAGQPCYVASTQIVEAGVDVDFPVVMRAVGPLDRIVQAAGRCNREGRLASGRVVVFDPAEGSVPPGTYRTATARTRTVLSRADADLHDPELYRVYFQRLYGDLNLDEPGIQALRSSLLFRHTSEAFRMIPDDTVSVLVPYESRGRELAEAVRRATEPSRGLLRALQPYLVNIRRGALQGYEARGMAMEIREGLYEWAGQYDSRLGLVAENDVLLA